MNPKISIIVPVYNLEKYLETTVKCLLDQTYDNLEIILVDDGSTDNSPIICDRLAEHYNNIISIHQKNAGVSAARNTGMAAASGDFIGFCDGDDTVDADIYEFMYNLLIEDDSDIAICEVRFILPNGAVREIATGEYRLWTSTKDFLIDFLSGKVKMSVDTKLFRRSVIENVEFSVGTRTYEDKLFCFNAALNANRISSKNTAKYTYHRRIGSSSITEFNEKYFDGIYVADKMLEVTKEKYPELTDYAECQKLASLLRIYKLMYTRGGLGKFPIEEQKIIRYVKAFDKSKAKKILSKKDYIRYRVLKFSKILFLLMTKLIDKK